MALMAGKNGLVIWDAAVGGSDITLAYAQNWSCTYNHEIAEITCMDSTVSWRSYMTGNQDWSATVNCLLPDDGTDVVIGGDDGMGDDECQLELYFHHEAATKYRAVYGNAICTGISVSDPVDGICTVTYSFQGISQLLWYSSNTVEPGE